MKEQPINDLFEVVRQTPTELSEAQVMEMITIIPTLPPPGSSWFNINLNSIIMTTTIVAVVSSVLIYFNNPQTNIISELPGQEPEQKTKIITSPDSTPNEPFNTQVEVTPQVNSVSKEAVQPLLPKASATPSTGQTMDLAELSADTFVADIEKKEPLPVQKLSDIPSGTNITSVEKQETKRPAAFTRKERIPTATITAPVESNTVINKKKPVAQLQLRKLKKTLMKELFNDRITTLRKSFMTVVEFKKSGVSVNFKALDEELSRKYQQILTSYAIVPGPDKRIVLDADFIMVGRFTDTGFAGEALGKKMKITFQDSTIKFKELKENGRGLVGSVSYSHTSSSSHTIFKKDEHQKKPDIYDGTVKMETEGSLRDAERNTKTASLLTDDPDEDALLNQGMYLITNPVIIHDKSGENPVRINNIEKFKRSLYNMLIQDKEVAENRADVNMEISPDTFKVNDNAAFSPEMRQKYIDFFRTYGFGPRKTLRVLMCEDFIFVGEFGEKNFSGTVEGTLTRDSIRGSMFEALLTRYPMFGSRN